MLRVVGIVSLLFAALGLWYAWGVHSAVAGREPEPDYPYFAKVYTAMAGVCVGLCLALAVTGVQLIRLRSRWSWVLALVMLAEIIYFFAVVATWSMDTEWSRSVVRATGVANGALSLQWLALFPVWGPWLAVRAHRKMAL